MQTPAQEKLQRFEDALKHLSAEDRNEIDIISTALEEFVLAFGSSAELAIVAAGLKVGIRKGQ